MKKTLIILERLNEAYMKQRLLLLMLGVQSVILALVVLIYANTILSAGKVNGELDYYQVRFFYNMTSVLIFVMISVYVPFLLANSLNKLYEDNIIEHMLAVKISIKDIVFAVYLRGLIYTFTLVIATFPIISISYYFGGFGIPKILRFLTLVFCYIIFLSSLSLFISSRIKDKNGSLILAYITSIVMAVVMILNLSLLLSSNVHLLSFSVLPILLSLVFLSLARNTHIFNT